MSKELITDKQGIVITAMFVLGSTLILGTGGQAKTDMWMAVILGFIFALPVIFIYSRLLYLYPAKNLFEINEEVLGKYAGKAVSVLYIWFAIHLGALVMRNYGEFIITVALPETPMIFVIPILGFLVAWCIKLGIEVLGRWGELFIIILMSFIIIIIFMMIPQMRPENLRPLLYNGLGPVFQGAFSAFSFPFAETVLLTTVFSGLKYRKSPYKVFFIGVLIAGVTILYASVRNVLVLGGEAGDLYFPSYHAVARVNIGNFLQRLEITVAVVFSIAGFIKTSVCLLGACNGIKSLFGLKDYRAYVTPVAVFMVILAYIVYDNIMEMIEWAFHVWPFYAFIFQVILPLVIYIPAEVKFRMKKKQNTPA